MGKCGGNELNYVSDVDVIFVAGRRRGPARRHHGRRPADRDLRAGGLAGRRRAAARGRPRSAGAHPRQPLGVLPAVGADLGVPGAAQGAAGGRRPWRSAQEWIDGLAPLVWHAAERPEAVEDVRAMRRRIIDNVPPRRARPRDQARAGRAARHRVRGAAAAARARPGRRDAARAGARCRPCARWSPAATWAGQDGETLLRGYRFLRSVEHRLQLQRLRRTHTVPAEPAGAALAGRRARLHRAARPRRRRGVPRRLGRATPREVRRLHVKLLYRPLLEAVARVPAEALRMTPEAARRRLELLGFADPAGRCATSRR